MTKERQLFPQKYIQEAPGNRSARLIQQILCNRDIKWLWYQLWMNPTAGCHIGWDGCMGILMRSILYTDHGNRLHIRIEPNEIGLLLELT